MRKQARHALRRMLVGSCDFTIVSNNCWGAHVYQALGIEYRTPFVGLFLPARDYLHLLGDFDRLIHAPLRFVDESSDLHVNEMRRQGGLSYPIAMLGEEVEVDFMHYRSAAEAESTWQRRVARMAEDRRRFFFKFDDIGASPHQVEQFCNLPLANKICFTAGHAALPQVVRVPADPQTGRIVDGYVLGRISKRYFNTLRWISTRPDYLPLPSLI